jgi:hypothetical protein
MLRLSFLRYGSIGLALVLSGLILGGVFAMLPGAAVPATAQQAAGLSSPETLSPTFEAAGIVISPTGAGGVFFNNSQPGVLTLTFTLTGTPPLTFTAEPAFGAEHVLTSPVVPWEAVLRYTVGVTAASQPPVIYSLTQSATVSATTTVITYTRDITGPQMTPLAIEALANSGVYADGMVVYHNYTRTTPPYASFILGGSAIDTLAGLGTVSATPALGTPAPVNGGDLRDWFFTYRIPSGITETGRITVTATDAVQNAAPLVYDYIHDPYPPTGTVQIANGAAYISTTHVSLQLTADDGQGCGVAEMCLSNTPECDDWRPFTPIVTDWELAAGDGAKLVYAWYKDYLGNTSALIQARPIRKDTIPPTVTVTAPARVAVPRIEVSWTAEDNPGGLGLGPAPKYTVAYRDEADDVWTRWLTNTLFTYTTIMSPLIRFDHTYVFSITVKDVVSNTGTGTAITHVAKHRVYLPLTLRSWVWWYAYDLYEPNDTPADAWGPLQSGTTYQAYIWDATDRDDYYYFTPSAAGNVVVLLSNIPVSTADYDLYIYYYDGTTYVLDGHYSNLTGSPTEQVEFTGTAGRKYFVRVYPYSGFSSTQKYSLRATYP